MSFACGTRTLPLCLAAQPDTIRSTLTSASHHRPPALGNQTQATSLCVGVRHKLRWRRPHHSVSCFFTKLRSVLGSAPTVPRQYVTSTTPISDIRHDDSTAVLATHLLADRFPLVRTRYTRTTTATTATDSHERTVRRRWRVLQMVYVGWMTYAAKLACTVHSCCDPLVPIGACCLRRQQPTQTRTNRAMPTGMAHSLSYSL